MIFSASTKFRVACSASAVAMTVGLAAGFSTPALAQGAGAVVIPPAPVAPAVPGTTEQCVLTAGVLTCAPGTDPDGFFDVSGDPIELDIQDGAVVQSSIVITGAVTGSVDGAILTSGAFDSGMLLGADSDVTINGFVQTDGGNAAGVETEANSTLVNNGTIYTTGASSDGVALADNSAFTNSGTVYTDGDFSNGVNGFGDGVVVVNTATGSIVTNGETAAGVNLGANGSVTNSGLIATTGDNFSDAVLIGENGSVVNSGTISTAGLESFGVFALGDNATVTNTATGVITTTGDGSFGVVAVNGGTVTNDGSISTSGEFAIGIDVLEAGTISNTGSIQTVGESAIGINAGTDSTVSNDGTISTAGDNAYGIYVRENSSVSLGANSAITTSGAGAHGVRLIGPSAFDNAGSILLSGVNATGVQVNGEATFTNSGSISSELGRGIDIGGNSSATNAATGFITSVASQAVFLRGDAAVFTNNGMVEGTVGVEGSDGGQTVVNFGSINSCCQPAQTGAQSGVAINMGGGADQVQQWTGATTVGDIDLGDGDDTFILEGTASSVGGTILGGAGSDTAIIAGTLDADNFGGFETYQLGSTLGGTLNDAVISGDRTIDGDVVVVGDVALELGTDSLTSTGSMTLESGSTVTIGTSNGADFLGQTITVLQEGTTFTDNGANIAIIDNDLLIDYQPVLGSLAVAVSAGNALTTSSDGNVAAFGTALNGALTGGTLSDANFAALNGLADEAALEATAADSLPSLSEGVANEIYKSSLAASQGLDRHLASDGSGVWGEFTYRGSDRDDTGITTGGYDSEQKVITLGGDFAFGDMGKVGVMASYADIKNDEFTAGVERGTSDVESIMLGVYSGFRFGGGGFVNAELSYLSGDVDQARSGVLGPIGSSFDFDGFGYRAVVGYDVLGNDTYSLTPSVGIQGASLSFDDAVETGGFGYTVSRDDADFMQLRAGVELEGEFSSSLSGYIGAAYVYDLEDDQRSFALNSAELGGFSVNVAEREQSSFELAAGAVFNMSDNAHFEIGYFGDFGSEYNGHAARASVRFGF